MKQYIKPDLYYEDFELATHIATCALDMSNEKDVYNCTATSDGTGQYPDGWVFFSGEEGSACGEYESLDDGYCYTVGSSNINIFNS